MIDYIRSNYARRTLQGEQEINLCHSLNEKTRPFGGSRSPSTDELYKKALERPTKHKAQEFHDRLKAQLWEQTKLGAKRRLFVE